MIFSEDGKYIISFAVTERYVAVWRIDGSKKKSTCCVLAMDHPAAFLDSRCTFTGDIDDEGLCVLAILEMGVCNFWYGENIDELRDSKPTKISVSPTDGVLNNKGAVPTIFVAKLQVITKPACGHLFTAYGSLIKPSFEKILVQPGSDIKLKNTPDGILLPISQTYKSKKGSVLQNQSKLTQTTKKGNCYQQSNQQQWKRAKKGNCYQQFNHKLGGLINCHTMHEVSLEFG